MGLTEDRLSPIVAPQPTYRQKKTHSFQISNMFRKTLAILALVALFSVACAAPQRALLQDETATAAPAPTTAPATDEIDTAANTTTTTTEEASASQAAAPEATMPQTGFEWMQAYNPYAQFLGGWYPGAGIEAYEAAMNATAAQFAGAGAGAFMPFRIPQMPQFNPQFYTPPPLSSQEQEQEHSCHSESLRCLSLTLSFTRHPSVAGIQVKDSSLLSVH